MVRVLLRAVVALLLCAAAGCSAPAPADGAERDVRRAVAAWPQRPPGIPFDSFGYEVTSVRRDGDRAVAAAELRYRLAGYDAAPATAAREVELTSAGGAWRVTAERPAPGAPAQPWDQGPVTVVHGTHALVLGTGQDRALLEAVADTVDGAVPAAGSAWPRPWAGRVVVLVPGSLDAMAALLGRPPSQYAGTAAVTTAATGAGAGPADRVVVNPQAYAQLSGAGRRIVLTHEVTHVATRAATTERTPLWLSEGFADWAAYRGSADDVPARAAPALARAVRAGQLPPALPADEAFGFGGEAEASARAYEGAWLACRLIAARWGEAALVALYEAAGREPLPEALRRTLGTDLPGLTQAWRAELRTVLSADDAQDADRDQ
ncbi:hypothetical protein [Streptomyces sp. NPDC090022]|uniref:hypothetical protein n=1 Tax=Streptomyces sp. NPDC090022 TaxID=3365920 RepID=UPI003822ACB4